MDASSLPSDADIRKILADRVQIIAGEEGGIGIVVGVVDSDRRRVVSVGQSSKEDLHALDGETCFEIGSIGKVFTALVLADMVQKGELQLADPVAKFLPGIKIPERKGRSITLLDLATHTSSLPFMPDEAVSKNSAEPTAVVEQLNQFLASYKLPYDIGSKWEYSNLGYWVLGQALTARAAMDFDSLVRNRIIFPLGMKSTAISTSRERTEKTAVGHDGSSQPSPPISEFFPLMATMYAAGSGFISSVNDLMAFLGAAMGYDASPLSSSMTAMLATRRPAPRGEQALGWTVITEGMDPVIFHDGGTLGYASAMGWDPKQRVGVAVLSNQVTSVGDIALHLLRPKIPLANPGRPKHKEIALSPTELNSHVGRYESDTETFTIAYEEGFLTIELPLDWGLPRLRLHSETIYEFFVKELPLKIIFQTSDDDRIAGMLVYPPRGQKAIPTKRSS